MALGILEREKKLGIDKRKIHRLCDPTCFNKKPDYRGGGQGPSTAEEFRKVGIELRESTVLVAQGLASRHLLGRTEWRARNVSEILLRLPGAKKTRARIFGWLNRCVEIPREYFLGEEDDAEDRKKDDGLF